MKRWIVALVFLAGCSQESKKAAPTEHRTPEAIPSDFEVNSFFAGGPQEIKVKTDGGAPVLPGDGGAASAAAAAADVAAAAAADTPDTTAAGAKDTKVLEPGDEPRVARRYELKAGRTDQIAVTLRTQLSQEVQGQPPQGGPQPGIVFSLALTPGAKDASGTTAVKLAYTKAEVLPGDVDPQQARQLSQAFAGQKATFKVSSRGQVSDFQLADPRMARSELGALAQQAIEGVFVTFPDEPIGKGGKWQQTSKAGQEELNASVVSTFTLKDVAPDGLTIAITSMRKAPAQPIPDPRAPRGSTIAVDGTSSANVKVRLDRIYEKGTLEQAMTLTITQPGPGGKAQTVLQKVNRKQTVDTSTP